MPKNVKSYDLIFLSKIAYVKMNIIFKLLFNLNNLNCLNLYRDYQILRFKIDRLPNDPYEAIYSVNSQSNYTLYLLLARIAANT